MLFAQVAPFERVVACNLAEGVAKVGNGFVAAAFGYGGNRQFRIGEKLPCDTDARLGKFL